MIRCVHCNTENEEIFTYCLSCGKPLEQSLASFRPRHSSSSPSSPGRLVVLRSDGSNGKEYPLVEGQNRIGRTGPEAVLEEDPQVEAEHAVLEVGRDVALIEDRGTRYGTFVRVRGQRALADGDQLRIGHAVFQIQLTQPLPPPASDGSVWLGSAGVQSEFSGRLLRLGPGDVVLEAYLLRTPETTIGRTVGEVLLPDDPFVSSRHAAFVLSGSGCSLKDLGSTNGCFLRIRGRVAIEDGDHFLVGHHLLRFNREGNKQV